jgi:hypothetical protein
LSRQRAIADSNWIGFAQRPTLAALRHARPVSIDPDGAEVLARKSFIASHWRQAVQDLQRLKSQIAIPSPTHRTTERKLAGGSTASVAAAYTEISNQYAGDIVMPHDPQHNIPPVFHIDVSASTPKSSHHGGGDVGSEIVGLLRQLVAKQEKQNQLLEEIGQQLCASQRQRATELGQWKQANPELAQGCRAAAETLSRVQTQFLYNLTEEVSQTADSLIDGEFMLNEFVDRFGPRLAHLNGVLQVLSQLSSVPNPTNATQ